MADEPDANAKEHGPSVELSSRTKQSWADVPLDVELPVRFWFTFPDGRRARIPDHMVPARAWDRVATYIIEGPDGLSKPPSHPQPNDAVGILPPPSAELDKNSK